LEENKKYLVWEWGRATMPEYSVEERDNFVLSGGKKPPSFNAMKGTLPGLGISSITASEIERSFMHLLEVLEAHFRQHKYLLGGRPCLGDFSLVGPMYAHLLRDPVPAYIMRAHAPAFCEYLERMHGLRPSYEGVFTFDKVENRLVPSPNGIGQFGQVFQHGDFLANDEIPSTLLPLIENIFHEHIPVLLSTAHQLKRYFEKKPSFDTELPRAIGYHTFALGQAKEKRAAYPYDVWMLQRCMDSISPADTSIVHPFIRSFSTGPQLLESMPWINSDLRLRSVDFKIFRDPSKPAQLVQSHL